MEKYRNLSAITNQYLHGKLHKLTIEYEDEDTMDVSILYEFANYYELDYKLKFDMKHQQVEFVSHNNEIGINKFSLDREQEFENAVKNTLLHSLGTK